MFKFCVQAEIKVKEQINKSNKRRQMAENVRVWEAWWYDKSCCRYLFIISLISLLAGPTHTHAHSIARAGQAIVYCINK